NRRAQLSLPTRRSSDLGFDALVSERLAEPGAVIATVGDQVRGVRQLIQHHRRPLVVADLAGAELEDDGPPALIAHGMQLGVQPADRKSTRLLQSRENLV